MIENVFKSWCLLDVKVGNFYNDEDEAFKVLSKRQGLFSATIVVRNIDTQKEFQIKEWFFELKKYEPVVKEVKK